MVSFNSQSFRVGRLMLAALLVPVLQSGAVAQPGEVVGNRGLLPGDVSVQPLPGGGGYELRITPHIGTNVTVPVDMSYVYTVLANGAEIGSTVVPLVYTGQGGEVFAVSCLPFCLRNCRFPRVCIQIRRWCICISRAQTQLIVLPSGGGPGQPGVGPGSVLTVHLTALPGSLPEDLTSDDALTITIPSACLADVASDGLDTTYTPNGSVGPEDLDAFIGGFIAGNAAVADVASDGLDTTRNPNGSVGSEDLDAFIGSFIAC